MRLLHFLVASLAQLGERQTEDLKVPGSIPGGGIFECLSAANSIECKGPTTKGASRRALWLVRRVDALDLELQFLAYADNMAFLVSADSQSALEERVMKVLRSSRMAGMHPFVDFRGAAETVLEKLRYVDSLQSSVWFSRQRQTHWWISWRRQQQGCAQD